MKPTQQVLLPGLEKQFNFLKNNLEWTEKKSLIIGSGTEFIASEIVKLTNQLVDIAVDNSESFLLTKLNLSSNDKISCSLMDFDFLDFKDQSYDLVYAQASISSPNRKKILREIHRVLKSQGYLCCGEIIKLRPEMPRFIQDILLKSNLSPLTLLEIKSTYEKSSFDLIADIDLSTTLKMFFELARKQANKESLKLSDNEKSYHKKMLNRFAHESNSFLKFGADKYLGFYSFLFQKRSWLLKKAI